MPGGTDLRGADGGQRAVRVLRTETARATASTQGMLTSSRQVLSLAPGGRFTSLPAYSPTPPGQIAIIYGVW